MPNWSISPTKDRALQEKMTQMNIKETDLEEKFIRSAGAGGQNVNKVATCVWLKHRPSGLVVKCQKERNQILNRYYARKILVEKIEAQILGRLSARQKEIARIRRQKKKRSKRAKEKILAAKKIQSVKKEFRKKITQYHE